MGVPDIDDTIVDFPLFLFDRSLCFAELLAFKKVNQCGTCSRKAFQKFLHFRIDVSPTNLEIMYLEICDRMIAWLAQD